MRLLFVLFFFGIVFDGHCQEERIDPPQIAIKILPGESVNVEDVELTFVEVLEDSRCPSSVDCIWNGRARVLLKLNRDGKDTSEAIVIFGELKQGEEPHRLLDLNSEYLLEAMQLNPYPAVPGEELEYSLLVKKVRKED